MTHLKTVFPISSSITYAHQKTRNVLTFLPEMMSPGLRTRNHLSPSRDDVSWLICLAASHGLFTLQLVRLVPISVTTIKHAACSTEYTGEMALNHVDISNCTVTPLTTRSSSLWASRERERIYVQEVSPLSYTVPDIKSSRFNCYIIHGC